MGGRRGSVAREDALSQGAVRSSFSSAILSRCQRLVIAPRFLVRSSPVQRTLSGLHLSAARSFKLATLDLRTLVHAKLPQHEKAQASMEYLLIVTFAMIALSVIAFAAYSQSASFSSDVTSSQIQKVGNQIVDAANAAYYAGPPTKKTITLYFPDLIRSINVMNQSIVFVVQGSQGTYEYAVYSSTPMFAPNNISVFPGLHTITILAGSGYVNITDR